MQPLARRGAFSRPGLGRLTMPVPARSMWIRRRAGLVQNEHAETGKPGHRSDRFRSRGRSAPLVPDQRDNGPAHVDLPVGMGMVVLRRQEVSVSDQTGGHKLSASGLPQRNTCMAGQPNGFATGWCRRPRSIRIASHAQVIPQACSHPPRPRPSPHHLADCPSRRSPLGGKARWQKRFVFPARRMKRGLQF